MLDIQFFNDKFSAQFTSQLCNTAKDITVFFCITPPTISATTSMFSTVVLAAENENRIKMAVAILPLTAIYPQKLFCRELFVIGQS